MLSLRLFPKSGIRLTVRSLQCARFGSYIQDSNYARQRRDDDRRPPRNRNEESFSNGGDSRRKSSRDEAHGSDFGNGQRERQPFGANDFGNKLNKISWEKEELVPFKKNFHVEHPEGAATSSEECRKFLQDAGISIKGVAPIPKPILKFEHAQFPDYIMNLLKGEAFSAPTAIQSIGWPIAMSGRDSVCVARTGSGKTLGFLMPALLHVAAQAPLRAGDGPIALVLAPTRELVMQISKDASTFGRPGGVLNAAIFGGVSRNGQANALRQGVEICVATPGRLLDFLETGVVDLKRVTYLVLDEADRMLDMGFEPQIRKIVSQIRPDRQTLMWSATWPKEIQKMARDFCQEDPVLITVGSSTLQANPDVRQDVIVLDSESEKRGEFKKWIAEIFNPESKMIVFCDTKKGADNLCRELTYNGYSALSIHGNKEQRERDQILRDFKNGEVQILVATDVAQRGLDIKAVDWVVNFDCPKTSEDYIHRIGRTGRAGAKGNSMTFVVRETDGGMMKDLARIIKDCNQAVPQGLEQRSGGNNDMRAFMNKRA